jgi:hypothetical protein
VRLEGLGKFKKFNDLIGNHTHDLPDYSIVPQPTTPQGVPPSKIKRNKLIFTAFTKMKYYYQKIVLHSHQAEIM